MTKNNEQIEKLYICDYGQAEFPVCVDLGHEYCKLDFQKSKECNLRAVVSYDDYLRKEQECEVLKKELENTKGLVTVGNRQLKEYLKENISLKVQKERYCQVLSDIQDEARDGYCSGTQTGCENSLHRILQKINEVIDD